MQHVLWRCPHVAAPRLHTLYCSTHRQPLPSVPRNSNHTISAPPGSLAPPCSGAWLLVYMLEVIAILRVVDRFPNDSRQAVSAAGSTGGLPWGGALGRGHALWRPPRSCPGMRAIRALAALAYLPAALL